MSFLADFLGLHRDTPSLAPGRRGMPKDGEPLGFFGLLTDEQERAVLAYRGDETVGDPNEMARILAAKSPVVSK